MIHFMRWKLSQFVQYFRREGLWKSIRFVGDKVASKLRSNLPAQNLQKTREDFSGVWQAAQQSQQNERFRVVLLVSSFFDLDGEVFQQGGAERYTLELSKLIRQMGGRLEVYQCGRKNWSRRFEGIDFFGLATGDFSAPRLSQYFHEWVTPGVLTIYYQMILSTPKCFSPSICVSHGVDWDAHWLQAQPHQYRKAIQTVMSSVRNVDGMVSVDTNTLNWLRATDAGLAQKCSYIPNFVDNSAFAGEKSGHEGIVLLYPRRLSEARGFWILTKIIPALLRDYPTLQIHFCGIAEPLEEVEVNHLCQTYPGRVLFYNRPPSEMPTVYAGADIVVIPTRYSEGTSLSCLEALSSECAVIASNVGGLPDLILSGYNGVLIEPSSELLDQAIRNLMRSPDTMRQLGLRGVETARAFSLEVWRGRWRSLLAQWIDSQED